jgi:transposase-like protein
MRTVTYSADFKRETIEELLGGQRRASQICRERGIDVTTLRRWRLAYEERGEAAWTPPTPEGLSAEAKIAQLERLIGQLTVENAVLKKALARAHSACKPATASSKS